MFRAHEHFEELVRVFDLFYTKHRESVQHFRRVHELIGFNTTVAIPNRIPLIVGDCLQNMRSSLDYLVWELVKANGCEPKSCHMFPICRKRSDFRKAIQNNRLLGIAPKAVEIIDQLQPYHLPFEERSRHVLSVLDELTNTNKHRHVIGTLFENRHPTSIACPCRYLEAKVSGTDEFGHLVATTIRSYIAFQDTSVKGIEITGALDTLFMFLIEQVFTPFGEYFC